MTPCPHAETTTLLWLYGELDDEAHAAHVAACPACREVASLHADVLSAVGPVAPALAAAPTRARRAWWFAPAVLALAAAVLLALLRAPAAPVPSPEPPPELALEDDLDQALDALASEVDLLEVELATL